MLKAHLLKPHLPLIVSLTLVGSALAHAELTGSSIEDGATVPEPPTEIVLSFSESVALNFSTFKVYPLPVEAAQAAPKVGASHAEEHAEEPSEPEHKDAPTEAQSVTNEAAQTLVAQVISIENDEDARVDSGARADGSTVTLSLQAALPASDYVVMWRAPSEDGHIVEGFLTFAYEPPE